MTPDGALPLQDDAGEADLESPLGARPTRITAPAMGAVAARGFYWLSSLSLATKFVATITQIVLSWFVTRTEFGLAGTSLTIASFLWLIQDAGLSQILIKRQRRFNVWCTSIFWLSIILGVITAILTGASGFIFSRVLHEPALLGLLLLLALRALATAPSGVPWAQLNKDMRFNVLALMGVVLVTMERGLMVLLTSPLFRWGAFGFIAAMLIVSIVRTALMWWYAPSRIKLSLQFHRWKYVARDSWLLSLAQTFQTITIYGDNLLLAMFRPADVVGDYYWAYNLSLQTMMLLTANLGGVLFPTLSRLQREPERMRQGFIRAARLLTMVGVPGCLLQAAVAKPLVELVFGTRWLTAVPALQILSLGMAMSLVPSNGLLRAQGRFATERTLAGICAVLFLTAALLGALLGGSLSMAIAVAIYNVISGVLYLATAIGPDWRKIGSILLLPLVLSIPTIGTGYGLSLLISPTTKMHYLIQAALITGIGLPMYLLAVGIFASDVWSEILTHLYPLARRLKNILPSAARSEQ